MLRNVRADDTQATIQFKRSSPCNGLLARIISGEQPTSISALDHAFRRLNRSPADRSPGNGMVRPCSCPVSDRSWQGVGLGATNSRSFGFCITWSEQCDAWGRISPSSDRTLFNKFCKNVTIGSPLHCSLGRHSRLGHLPSLRCWRPPGTSPRGFLQRP